MLKTQITNKIMQMLLCGIWLLAGCSGFNTQATTTEEPIVYENVSPLVSATGVVEPAQWARLSMPTTGIVEEILVTEGDYVQTGQVLVRLQGREEYQAAITAAKYEVIASEKALSDLNEAAEVAKIQALQAISAYAKQVRDAQYQLDNFTVPANQVDLDPMEAVVRMKAELDKAREAFEPYRNTPENNETRKDLKEALDEAQSNYNTAIRRLEYETTLRAAQANLEKAEQDYAIWKEGPDPKEISVAEARLENAKTALAAAEAALSDLELKAPFAGVVSELDTRLGELVTLGQPILLLADLERLQVKTTDLNEIDAARVQLGDPVKVSFDALPDITVTGVVTKIALKPAAGTGVNYAVVIELTEWPQALRWGMTAFVDIEIE